MSIAPRTLWSERFEEIGELIEKNAELLTERWQQRVAGEHRESLPAHYKEMRDRLPELLRTMGRALAVSNHSVPAPHAMLARAWGAALAHRLAIGRRDSRLSGPAARDRRVPR